MAEPINNCKDHTISNETLARYHYATLLKQL